MSDRKFTDDEIIKALRCCKGDDIPCESCPYSDLGSCESAMAKDALVLINRQKAEIERLQKTGASAIRRLIETKGKADKELDKLKGVINLLERDIADRDKMLEGKVEEVYADFMQDYRIMRDELEDLLDSGTLIPPVKIGQTVYAAIIFAENDILNENTIEPYTVDGIGIIDGKWHVYSKRDSDWYEYGGEFCKPTREEAEAAIAAARSAADIKDGRKNGGAE